jgi:hypothetical protein
MDFLADQRLVYTSKENESIYTFLNEKYGLKYHEAFLLFAVIGFRSHKRITFKDTGREFRSNYLKISERVSLYTILLKSDLDITFESFSVKDNHSKLVKILEEYAEGGLHVLISEVFKSKYLNGKLQEGYINYIPDIMNYIYKQVQSSKF